MKSLTLMLVTLLALLCGSQSACASFCASRARRTAFGVGPVLRIEERIAPDRDLRIGLGDLTKLHADVALACIRARTVSESMRTPLLSLVTTSSSIACMIEGTPAITIALSIQKPGAPDTLLRMRSAPLGMRVMRRRASFIWAPVFSTHSCKMSSARVDRHTERLRHAVGSDVTVGRPDSAGGEDIGVAMPERIECIDDRFLLIADHRCGPQSDIPRHSRCSGPWCGRTGSCRRSPRARP